jgi:hypothetical protein
MFDKGVHRSTIALDVNLDALGRIQNPTPNSVINGETVDKRPEAHALHNASHLNRISIRHF